MNKAQLIDACSRELGVEGTHNEKRIRSILSQLYDAKPDESLEDTYKQELLLQLKHRYRKKKNGLMRSFNRYRASVLIIPLIVLLGFSFWRPNNHEQPSVLIMQEEAPFAEMSDTPISDEPTYDNSILQDDTPQPLEMNTLMDSQPESMMMGLQGEGEDEDGAVLVSAQQAIETVQASNPEFTEYPSSKLPVREIKIQPYENGRYLGFLRLGSGRENVLSATCFRVNAGGNVEETGLYTQEQDVPFDAFNVSVCR